jgi:alkaline phosphatase D
LRLESGNPRSPIVATEFVTTSIASTGPNYQTFAEVARNTPDVRFFESRRRGYLRVEIVPARLTADLRVVSDVLDPQATASTLTSFVVEDGRPGVVS